MTQDAIYRALVVDDEPIQQKLVIRALKQQGFQCDAADDGNEAEELVLQCEYDAVITDLRMPNKHGHALAVQLLGMQRPPVIVVLTGLLEPKVAADLLARGVDDVVFKPFDFGVLAAKVKALVKRRFTGIDSRNAASNSLAASRVECRATLPVEENPDAPVTVADLENALAGVSRLLPLSTAAFDVYRMTNDQRPPASQLAAAIQRDAAFAVEVLRLANSSYYNPAMQPIVQLEMAVILIGEKRIGELALGMNALATLTSSTVPWMDVGLAWRQSMAAGLAMEMLIEHGEHLEFGAGVLLGSIMHPLGRIVMGSLYPQHYVRMVEQCHLSGESLSDQERRIFPWSHSEALSRLLAGWNIPNAVRGPLGVQFEDFSVLSRLPEPDRTKAELVKLAGFVGRIAVESWETWESVEVPSASLTSRLGITDLGNIIEQVRTGVEWLAAFQSNAPPAVKTRRSLQPTGRLACYESAYSDPDYLRWMLPAMGIQPEGCADADLVNATRTLLVNCAGADPYELEQRTRCAAERVFVIDAEHAEQFAGYGRTIAVPCSFRRLRDFCRDASYPADSMPQRGGTVMLK